MLTLTSPSKKLDDPTAPLRSRLEQYDIKITLDYEVSQTSHVISNKRNTAKGLQALINAKWIVTENFVDALEAVAEAQSTDTPSLLEEDFVANWPSEINFLPPAGREPIKRQAELFIPNSKREDVFGSYTFIFCDRAQFETLQPPITNGHGKAFLYEVKMGKTSVEDFMNFMKEIAGNQSHNERSSPAPVVVQFNAPPEHVEWTANFIQGVSLEMDQRAINQTEFLDAVVMSDASTLRRALQEDEEETADVLRKKPSTRHSTILSQNSTGNTTNVPPSAAVEDRTGLEVSMNRRVSDESAQAQNSLPVNDLRTEVKGIAAQPSLPASRRRITRGTSVQSRFKGFDDFDASQLPKTRSRLAQGFQREEEEEEHDDMDVEFAGESSAADKKDRKEKEVTGQQAVGARKRPARSVLTPLSDVENEDEVMNDILAGATALKKRRLADGQHFTQPATEEAPLSKGRQVLAQKPRPKKEIESLNVKELVMNRREEEEKRRQEDEEALRQAMNGVDISSIRGMATIEEFEPRSRSSPLGSAVGTGDNAPGLHGGVVIERQGWHNSWNGRKNFKKFRRKGEPAPIRGSNRVIVPLEEVRRKDFGIEDEYWLDTSNSGSRSKSQSQGQGQSQSVQEVRETPLLSQSSRPSRLDENPDDGSFRRRNRRPVNESNDRVENDVVEVLGTPVDELSVPVSEKTATAPNDRIEESEGRPSTVSTSRKRPAQPTIADRPSKRREKVVEDSDGEDEGRFRFRRRR